MNFEGDTVVCSGCGRKINREDSQGDNDDGHLCSGCAARGTQLYANTPCHFCKKPVGIGRVLYNTDNQEQLAHEECIPDKEMEEWSDEYD